MKFQTSYHCLEVVAQNSWRISSTEKVFFFFKKKYLTGLDTHSNELFEMNIAFV